MNVNLFLFKEDGSSRVFPLPSSVTVIGRQRQCDLCIPLMVISRRHCELSTDGGQLRVRDIATKNGTFINGERVDESVVEPGDVIGVGPVSFIVQINGNPMHIEPPLEGEFRIPEPTQYRGQVSHHDETMVAASGLNDDGFSMAEADLVDNIQRMVPESKGS